MGEQNLALALEGRAKAAHGNEQLLVIAEALAALPDPEIDQAFMLALEHRLLTEELVEQPVQRLQVVPAFPPTPADEVVRRAQVVRMPKRRFTVRRSVAAIAAAASLAAFPMAAVASSLPGSPFYGLELRVERAQLALFGTPVEDGFTHLRLAEERVAEAEQLAELGADPDAITLALELAQAELKMATSLVLANTDDPAILRRLSAEAAGAEETLRDAAGSLAQTGDAFDDALDATQSIQDTIARLLGIDVTSPTMPVSTTTTGIFGSGSSDQEYAQQRAGSNGPSEDGSDDPQGPIDDDGTKKPLDPGDEGCAVFGSEMGLGDALAPLAKLGCDG